MKLLLRLTALGAALILATSAMAQTPVQTYHANAYRWGTFPMSAGATSYDWGRIKHGDICITLDLDGRKVTVKGPRKKEKVYTILDEHPTAYEKENMRFTGSVYCLLDECDIRSDIYVRSEEDIVRWVYIYSAGSVWQYFVNPPENA